MSQNSGYFAWEKTGEMVNDNNAYYTKKKAKPRPPMKHFYLKINWEFTEVIKPKYLASKKCRTLRNIVNSTEGKPKEFTNQKNPEAGNYRNNKSVLSTNKK